MLSVSRNLVVLRPSLVRRPARFVLVGASGVGVSTVVLWIGTRDIGLPAVLGGLLAAMVSTFTNFLLNDRFTWADRRRAGWGPWRVRLQRYYVTTALGNLIYVVVLTTLVHFVRFLDLLANLIAICTGGVINYILHNLWTWHAEERGS